MSSLLPCSDMRRKGGIPSSLLLISACQEESFCKYVVPRPAHPTCPCELLTTWLLSCVLHYHSILQYTTVYYSILQYITVYHSILQYITVYHIYHSILQYTTVYHSIPQYITVYHSRLSSCMLYPLVVKDECFFYLCSQLFHFP